MIKNTVVISALEGIERFVYRKADFITTISSAMRLRIMGRVEKEGKVGLFLNWACTEEIVPMDKRNSFSRKYKLDDKFVVLNAGNMGDKHDIQVILEAAKILKSDNSIVFVFAGGGARKGVSKKYASENDLANVMFLDIQSENILNEMFASCDIALITQHKDIRDSVMPSKVLGPACAERPVILASHEDCEICDLVKKHRFGLAIPPEDPAALVAAIYQLKGDRELAVNFGKNARRYMCDNLERGKILSQFENTLTAKYGR